MAYQGALFDLDGVLVDTAKYHYLAWKELAASLGFEFSIADNERLKGVSRMDSLAILLSVGGMENRFSDEEKEQMAKEKNERYVGFISKMDASEILEGTVPVLEELRKKGIGIALGSASKNSPLILERTGLSGYFDVVVDGNSVSAAKPDPEVFVLGAKKLGLFEEQCAVFEDSEAGLQAARVSGMLAVGIGRQENLPSADIIYPNLGAFPVAEYF